MDQSWSGTALRTWLPVLRDRRRYIAFELDAEGSVQKIDLIREIHASQTSLVGDLGASENRMWLISFDRRFGLIRCSHRRTGECRAILATIRSIKGIRVAIRVRGVSGTIKAATEKYIPQSILQADEGKRRINLGRVSGSIVRIRGREIDLYPDDQKITGGSDTQYLGLTSFDLCGGDTDADGISDV
ncbi:MAG: Rpp14/Pop5 family protein [Methanotrichaceae archaeon]